MGRPKRVFRKIERTPEGREELRREHESFSRERPSMDDRLATGEYDRPFRQGDILDLLAILSRLREVRLARGLTLAEVSARSGIDPPALSRLEGGKNLNPTVDTLRRYATAVGARIAMEVQEIEPTMGLVP